MEADGRVADGRVAPTPFNRCKRILYVNATSTSSESAFSSQVVSLLSSMQSRAIPPANQLDAIFFLNQNRAYLFNMHHSRVVVESRC